MTTGVYLPTPVPSGSDSGLELVDYRDLVRTATAGADFTATVTFDQVDAGYFWLIDRLVVSTSSSSPTTARVYLDQVDPGHLVNATGNGNLDVDDANSPQLVDSSSTLIVVWSGAAAGYTATARAQFRLMRRV